MAGHSPWKNIRHKKAVIDAKRGKLWSKCARAIIVAAKNGGGDPDSNLSLRYAVDEAKAVNMPRETIEKAIKKGTGELGGENYEDGIYEGYGPGGVAMMLEILTNNRNRTSSEVRGIFDKHGGNLGASGCVSYIFQSRGRVGVNKEKAGEEKVMAVVLEAGAEDVVDEGESWGVICEPAGLMGVRKALEAAGIAVEEAGIIMVPSVTVAVSGEVGQRVLALIDVLEDNDDVQKVHANFEIPDSELADTR